jgi:hypothetical protein
MKFHVFLALFYSLLISSCKKDNSLKSYDYFIFGHTNRLCTGDCASFFKIQDGKIYQDTISQYRGSITFSASHLSEYKYQTAKPVLDSFPVYLLNNSDSVYGCPDCSDQGLLYIEIGQNYLSKKWFIDPYLINIPEEIRPYAQLVQDIINQLH